MTTTTPGISRDRAPARGPTTDRAHSEPRDPTAASRATRTALHDDGSHTPPHGDPLVSRREPALGRA